MTVGSITRSLNLLTFTVSTRIKHVIMLVHYSLHEHPPNGDTRTFLGGQAER
jgi:hypothetical protein